MSDGRISGKDNERDEVSRDKSGDTEAEADKKAAS